MANGREDGSQAPKTAEQGRLQLVAHTRKGLNEVSEFFWRLVRDGMIRVVWSNPLMLFKSPVIEELVASSSQEVPIRE